MPATNKKFLVRTSSLMQPVLFLEIPATNYKILVRADTGTRDSSLMKTASFDKKYLELTFN